MAVSDRWHKSHPGDDEPRCGEHRGKVASTMHGTGKRWQVRYRDDSGQQVARNFERLGDAQALDSKVQRELATGSYLDLNAGKVTVAEFARQRWLPSQLHLRAGSAERYRQACEGNIIPLLGRRQLASLKPVDIRAFIGALSVQPSAKTKKPLAPTTIATVAAVLKLLLSAAVHDRLISSNPASRVPLPRVEKKLVHPLPKEDVLRVAGKISPGYRVAVMLAALGGLREGEVLGLRVADVDFLRRRVQVRQQAQGGKLVPLKTRASTRTVPLDDMTLAEITEHMRKYPVHAAEVLITNRVGKTPQRNAFGEAWRNAVKAAGLPAGTRFHDLRHFYASVLIAANLNPKVIQARMGHSNISETMDTYGHLFPDSDELGRGAFDTLFANPDVHGKCTGEAGS